MYIPVVFRSVSKLDNEESLCLYSDEELIVQTQQTNSTLPFSILYDRYATKIYNKCYSFSKNQSEAEDLTQDVFLKLFTKLHTFKGQSKFSTWLYSFTYNFCVNYVTRDKARKKSRVTDSIDNHEYRLSVMEDIKDEDLFELQATVLNKVLNKIAPEEKAILLLKYQDDVTIKELQILLNISESAVKMRLKRARIKVMEVYKNTFEA